MAHPAGSGDLQVRRHRYSKLVWLVLVVAVGAVAAWYATHPSPLPTSTTPVTVSTPAGDPVYVGVLTPSADSDRTVTVRGIDVDPLGDLPVNVDGKVCKGGALAVTSEPETFCTSLVDAEGASLGPGDTLVLEIYGETTGEVDLGRVRVTYREGLQWGSHVAGPPVTVTFLSR